MRLTRIKSLRGSSNPGARTQTGTAPIIWMTPRGIFIGADAATIRQARAKFKRENHLRISGFIQPELLAEMRKYLRSARFEESEYGVGSDLVSWHSPVAGALHLLMNDPRLLKFIQRISGCSPIGSFTGRLYRMIARPGMNFDWHSDLKPNDVRVGVAMTINLGARPYRGGILQMRHADHDAISEIPNTGPGDAIVFRLAPDLRHRVTPVKGREPKTAFTGWFVSAPSFGQLRDEWISGGSLNGVSQRSASRPLTASPDQISSEPDGIVALTNGDETIAANIRTGHFHGLNATAARMWELLGRGRSLRSSARMLAREYGVRASMVERDLLTLAADLAARRLITLRKIQ